MDGLMTSSRSAALQSLQKLREMDEFLSFLGVENNISSRGLVSGLFDKWISRQPNAILEPTIIWDDIITNR